MPGMSALDGQKKLSPRLLSQSLDKSKVEIWNGWHISTVFCIGILVVYPFVLSLFLLTVKSNPDALIDSVELGGPLPYRQWEYVFVSFLACLFFDFISWLWTVDGGKSRLFLFVVVINGLSAISYGLLAMGVGPVILDSRGKRFVIMRYLHWLFTTPAMLFVYSLVCSISWKELVIAMCMEFICISTGFLASVLPHPHDLSCLAISCLTFYFVVRALDKMLVLAIEESAPFNGTSVSFRRKALRGARIFLICTWTGMPTVWFLAYFDAISFRTEETLYEILDFATKAGISSLILHSSIKTFSENQARFNFALTIGPPFIPAVWNCTG